MCCFRCRNLLIGIIATLALILALIALAISFGLLDDIIQPEGIQAQLIGAGGGIMPDGENVLFDSILNDQSDSISYDSATGVFIVTKPGTYDVAWWTAPDGAGPATNISFAVAVNGTNYSTASSPIVSDEMAAHALVTVTTVPTTISLVNVTGEDVFVPNTPVQAGIVITN